MRLPLPLALLQHAVRQISGPFACCLDSIDCSPTLMSCHPQCFIHRTSHVLEVDDVEHHFYCTSVTHYHFMVYSMNSHSAQEGNLGIGSSNVGRSSSRPTATNAYRTTQRNRFPPMKLGNFALALQLSGCLAFMKAPVPLQVGSLSLAHAKTHL